MVVAGVPHPDYDREFTGEDHAVIEGRACWIGNHSARSLRSLIPVDELARFLKDVPGAIAVAWMPQGQLEFLSAIGIPEVGFLAEENLAVSDGRACWRWEHAGDVKF